MPANNHEFEEGLQLARRTALRLFCSSYAVRSLGQIADVEQIACLGLVEAARDFDRSIEGAAFGKFALPRIRGAVLDAARKGAFVRVPRGAFAVGVRPPAIRSLQAGKLRAPRSRRRRDDLAAAVDAWLRSLPRRDRAVIKLRYGFAGDQASLRQIGRLVGLSESGVSRSLALLHRRGRQAAELEQINLRRAA